MFISLLALSHIAKSDRGGGGGEENQDFSVNNCDPSLLKKCSRLIKYILPTGTNGLHLAYPEIWGS